MVSFNYQLEMTDNQLGRVSMKGHARSALGWGCNSVHCSWNCEWKYSFPLLSGYYLTTATEAKLSFSFLVLSAELWPCDPNTISEVHNNCKKSWLRNPRKHALKTIGKSDNRIVRIWQKAGKQQPKVIIAKMPHVLQEKPSSRLPTSLQMCPDIHSLLSHSSVTGFTEETWRPLICGAPSGWIILAYLWIAESHVVTMAASLLQGPGPRIQDHEFWIHSLWVLLEPPGFL